jgi:hypothetical protein
LAGVGKEDNVMSGGHGVARKEIEEPLEARKQPGLCMTCVHNATCTFRRDPAQPVIHCEEFDGFVKVEADFNRRLVPVRVRATSAQDDPEDVAASQAKGLCQNCAHRNSCMFPKSEAGVWHCEEYE